ncbi:hypothetical protein LMG26824_02236 [Stenotrophomonas maltophilia]
MVKRLTHIGSTLRSRPDAEKPALIAELEQHVWPYMKTGQIKPQIYRTFPLENAREANELLDSGRHVGKIVLTTSAASVGGGD